MNLPPPAKRRGRLLLKLAVTVAIIAALVAKIDFADVADILFALNPSIILAAVLLHSGAFVFGAARWWLLFRQVDVDRAPFSSIVPGYYIGLLFNNVLPSSMGGDIVRTLHLSLRGLDAKALAGSAIIDRAIGLAATLVLGCVGLALTPDVGLRPMDKLFIGLAAIAAPLAGLFFFSEKFRQLMEWLARRYQHTKVRAFLLDTIWVCHSYRTLIPAMFRAGLLTLLVQALVIFVYYLLGNAVGINISLATYFALVPVVFLLSSIPVSVGGLGVREGALVVLLSTAGVDGHTAAALSIAYLVVLWLSSLPGVAVLLWEKKTVVKVQPSDGTG